ncbi:hypothetical protein EDD86DRAFT_244948 [Gorgonomyces haynaldii]|nr:hypothetical protein EDD86DRAFT_244948 [Gorgonomyces haynaldii]
MSRQYVKKTDAIEATIEKAQTTPFYIVQELGPMAFIIRDQNDFKFKMWVMLKVFHVPSDSDILFQPQLVDREIDALLSGRRRYIPKPVVKEKEPEKTDEIQAKEIDEEDVCPICQEQLLDPNLPTIHCRFSCGNSIHSKCVGFLMEHQQSMLQDTVKCPLCRSSFGTTSQIKEWIHGQEKPKQQKLYRHQHRCNECHANQIVGNLYRCNVCPDLHLCESCFNNGAHNEHSFKTKTHRTVKWLQSKRAVPPMLPETYMQSLQDRELTDQDYDTLLTLNNGPQLQGSIPLHVITSFPLKKLTSHLDLVRLRLDKTGKCEVCCNKVKHGELLRQIPCGHGFHQQCIDKWLMNHRSVCPTCGQAAFTHVDEEHVIAAPKKLPPIQKRTPKEPKPLKKPVPIPQRKTLPPISRVAPSAEPLDFSSLMQITSLSR